MYRFVKVILVIMMSLLLLSACMDSKTVTGNGKIVTNNRAVQGFSEIELTGAYRVNFEHANKPSLAVTADSNLQPYIITRDMDGTLTVMNKRGYSISTKELPIITVKGPRLSDVTVDGSGILRINGLKQTAFTLTMSGDVRAELSGQVDDFTVTGRGASKIYASDLKAQDVSIDLMGAGTAYVYASTNLSVQISGSGYVEYYGSPGSVTQSIQGAGKIVEVPSNARHTN